MRYAAISAALALVLTGGIAAAQSSNTPAAGGGADVRQASRPGPNQGAAPITAKAQVIVLHASNDGPKTAPKLERRFPQLTQPPLSSYKSYRLLEELPRELQQGKAQSVPLPDKGVLNLRLKEVSRAPDGQAKYVMEARIEKAGGEVFLRSAKVNVKQDRVFFLAGQSYLKGILVLGIQVSPDR